MNKINISIVSFLNTLPFRYGLENSVYIQKNSNIFYDIPSECARKLIHNEAEIGLIPIAAIPEIPGAKIISDYCLSSTGNVETVLLLSDVPLDKIEKIYLDYHSRSSVKLVQILCKFYWKINPEFIPATENYEKNIKDNVAGLVIGDRTFNLRKQFEFQIDLSSEWMKFKNLPFVFAAWVSNKSISDNFLSEFNSALKTGTEKIDSAVDHFNTEIIDKIHLKKYLTENIQYNLNDKKHEAIRCFLELANHV